MWNCLKKQQTSKKKLRTSWWFWAFHWQVWLIFMRFLLWLSIASNWPYCLSLRYLWTANSFPPQIPNEPKRNLWVFQLAKCATLKSKVLNRWVLPNSELEWRNVSACRFEENNEHIVGVRGMCTCWNVVSCYWRRLMEKKTFLPFFMRFFIQICNLQQILHIR